MESFGQCRQSARELPPASCMDWEIKIPLTFTITLDCYCALNWMARSSADNFFGVHCHPLVPVKPGLQYFREVQATATFIRFKYILTIRLTGKIFNESIIRESLFEPVNE